MMKKLPALLLSLVMLAGLLAACGNTDTPASQPAESTPASVSASSEPASTPQPDSQPAGESVRAAGLKGPTTMGMVKLMEDAEQGLNNYDVEMFGTADEIVTKLVGGELDVAAIPANLASVLYNNTGSVQVAAINTLGVLYVVETGESIQSVEDLRGKTVYSTGKGTTPEFALNHILSQNGLDPLADLTIEFKSESTEVAALMAESSDAIAVLPQPYVTALQMQNEQVRVALSLSDEWDKVSDGSGMVTGVLVARSAWLLENNALFTEFLASYKASIEWVNGNVPEAAELVAKFGIVEKAAVAEKALPACNIVYIDGAEMEEKLGGYLQVLFEQLPESIGGAVPEQDFYFLG